MTLNSSDDESWLRLVSVLHSAAERYGTERRVILLHGPVGSSKSTIARLLKRGLEDYSRTPEGALYTFHWALPPELEQIAGGQASFRCPMHEEPLHLIPPDWRERALISLGVNTPDQERVRVDGDLDGLERLVDRALEAGKPAHLIDDASELDAEWFEGKEAVREVYEKILAAKEVEFFSSIGDIISVYPDYPKKLNSKAMSGSVKVRELLTRSEADLVYAKTMEHGQNFIQRFAPGQGEFLTDNCLYDVSTRK